MKSSLSRVSSSKSSSNSAPSLKSSSSTSLSLKSSSNTSPSLKSSLTTIVDESDKDDEPLIILDAEGSSNDINNFVNGARNNLKRGISDSDSQSPLMSQSKPQYKKLKAEDEFR